MDPVQIVLDAFTELTGEDAGENQLACDESSMWDSLTHVYLVYAIEQRLGVELPEQVLAGRANLGELVTAVRRVTDRDPTAGLAAGQG